MHSPPASVNTFPGLIRWLAEEYHDGAVSAMAERLGVSIATPNFWARGVVLPNLDNIERICQAYGLKFDLVRELVFKSQQARRRRPTPTMSGASATPVPLPVESEAPLVAEVPPAPPCVVSMQEVKRHYVNFRPAHHQWVGFSKDLVRKMCREMCDAIRASAAHCPLAA